MDERSPRRPVALNQHLAGGIGDPDQIVHNDIRTKARRRPISGRITKKGRAEPLVGELRDIRFDEHLRTAVGRNRVERGGLVQHSVASGAVEAARRGEQESRYAGLLGGAGQRHAPEMVDVVRAGFVETPQRIVGQGGEVDDRSKAAQIGRYDVPDVLANRRDGPRLMAEVASLVQIGIEADDGVTGTGENLSHHGADVAVVACDEYLHSSFKM